MKNKIKPDLLKDLLLKLHFEDEEIVNIEYDSPNKLIHTINSKKLSQELKYDSINYFLNFEDLLTFQDIYGENFREWQVKKDELANISEKNEMNLFVNKFFRDDIKLGYSIGDVSDKEINEIVNLMKPKLSASFRGKYNRFYNFNILNINQLHLMLHYRFDSFKGNSYVITTIFSFWFDKPVEIHNLENNYINDWFYCHNLARTLMNKLEIQVYKKLNLFSLESLKINNIQNDKEVKWPQHYPEMLITYVKKTLNINPSKIIEMLIEDLTKIYEDTWNYKEKNSVNPNLWFQNLSDELKIFYNKGKEIFLNTSKILESKSTEDFKEEDGLILKERREKLSFENIVFMFSKALEVDLEDKKSKHEAGFRTRKSLFDEFLNKEIRDEKYDFIKPVSRGTFYSTFNKYENELNAVLEKDSSRGKGGGDVYRIRKPEILSQKSHKLREDLVIINAEIKGKIHEGLVYYDEENYDDSIRIFEQILKTGDLQHPNLKSDLLGVRYFLGKSYMKINLFKLAQKQFDSIFKLDEYKLDNRFRLLICLYKLGEYDEVEKIAKKLFEEVSSILSPYSSLEEQHKDTLYKENIEFFFAKPEDIHPNLFRRDLFSKNLIMMNRYYYPISLRYLGPKIESNWEEYQKKIEELEEMEYYIGNNVSFYRKLKLIQLNVEKYLVEILRKQITTKLFILSKEEEFYTTIEKKLEILNQYVINGLSSLENIKNFLNYLIKLSQLYYRKETNSVSKSIKQKFGSIDSKLTRGGFPYKTRFIPYFLYLTSSVMNKDNYNWAQKDFHKTFGIPELELEFFCLELYQITETELPKLEGKIMENSIKLPPDSLDVDKLFDRWKYEINISQYSGIEELTLKTDKYLEMAKSYKLTEYETILNSYLTKLEQGYIKIQKIKSKTRNMAFNAIFSSMSKEFKNKINKKIIDYSMKPEKFNYRSFYYKLNDQIFSNFHEFLGENLIKVKIFNNEVLNSVYNKIKPQIKNPDVCDLNKKANEILIQKYRETNLKGNTLFFHKYIDYFLYDLFDTIKFGSDKLILRYSTEFEDMLKEFFEEQFSSEINNPFFRISVDHNSQDHFYFLKITKKEVI